MNEVIVNDVRKGLYLDSVALMRMSRAISNMDGVIEAAGANKAGLWSMIVMPPWEWRKQK